MLISFSCLLLLGSKPVTVLGEDDARLLLLPLVDALLANAGP